MNQDEREDLRGLAINTLALLGGIQFKVDRLCGKSAIKTIVIDPILFDEMIDYLVEKTPFPEGDDVLEKDSASWRFARWNGIEMYREGDDE